ncbi:MAG: DUF1932 domain-containing protein [Ardenticatenales bacterium]|nr:DUF1932 domain-containing protein [Ardenticatenales bacterium]
MSKQRITFLHPGNMGISLAATAQNSGHEACWVAAGRRGQTRTRAEEHGLTELATLAEAAACDAIVSICPPAAALDVAAAVAATGFQGLYLDANAIAPATARAIAELVTGHGMSYVDGGVIGGPAWEPNRTWLYLSGPRADEAAELFVAGPLETQVLGEGVDQASAIKVCYAAYTKGTTALLAAILGAAEALDVREPLMAQWDRNWPGFDTKTENQVRQVTAKAWRFAGEMEEIAATFVEVGLPSGFHQAAHDIYQRLAGFKDAPEVPGLDEVLASLGGRNPERN